MGLVRAHRGLIRAYRDLYRGVVRPHRARMGASQGLIGPYAENLTSLTILNKK